MLGIIDIWGPAPTLGGLVLGGWIDRAWAAAVTESADELKIDNGRTRGAGIFCLYQREDVQARGMGFVALVQMPGASDTGAYRLITRDQQQFELMPSDSMERYDENQLFRHARHFLRDAGPDDARTRFLRLLERPTFTGADTLESLPWPVHVHVDRTYFCPPNGLIAVGWYLDPFRQVAELRICGAGTVCPISPNRWVKIRRRDVVDGFASRYDLPDEMLGFMVYAPAIFRPDSPLYCEIETIDGRVVHRPFSASLRTGLSAIKEILSDFEVRREAVETAYTHVVGPAVEAINAFRLRAPPEVGRIDYGVPPARPRCSLVIPLYGRVDFLEYQLAFFHDTLAPDHELIYVLDDPARRAETLDLADSAFARFDRPFTVLVLSHNVGYAPANNIGLAQARGQYVCFLNSDVFPDNPDWLECMIETVSNPKVGIVGAFLCYEDGTLQHDGCTLERLPDLGNWPFPMHPHKGLERPQPANLLDVEIVTGACMVIERQLARRLEGFDEGYVIGDFEDADLCKRVAQSGLRIVVDPRATLYHLERQSQNILANRWRFNLTLYNAWRFKTRWYA